MPSLEETPKDLAIHMLDEVSQTPSFEPNEQREITQTDHLNKKLLSSLLCTNSVLEKFATYNVPEASNDESNDFEE